MKEKHHNDILENLRSQDQNEGRGEQSGIRKLNFLLNKFTQFCKSAPFQIQ